MNKIMLFSCYSMMKKVRVTGSSCYNFHVFNHIMQTKRATLIIFSIRQDEHLQIQ